MVAFDGSLANYGSILEDEKVVGIAHVAFGTNESFGGTNAWGELLATPSPRTCRR